MGKLLTPLQETIERVSVGWNAKLGQLSHTIILNSSGNVGKSFKLGQSLHINLDIFFGKLGISDKLEQLEQLSTSILFVNLGKLVNWIHPEQFNFNKLDGISGMYSKLIQSIILSILSWIGNDGIDVCFKFIKVITFKLMLFDSDVNIKLGKLFSFSMYKYLGNIKYSTEQLVISKWEILVFFKLICVILRQLKIYKLVTFDGRFVIEVSLLQFMTITDMSWFIGWQHSIHIF